MKVLEKGNLGARLVVAAIKYEVGSILRFTVTLISGYGKCGRHGANGPPSIGWRVAILILIYPVGFLRAPTGTRPLSALDKSHWS